MDQKKALLLLKSGANVFLTGSAGTGKTYVLNKFIEHLKDARINVAVTASTGVASTHIKGVTIHSWSGIGVKQRLTSKDLDKIRKNKRLLEQFEETKVLIIDEVSMLHKDQLESIHQVLTHCLRNPQAFGGIQVVLCGDFFQLPPIGQYGELSKDKFAFMSPAWVFADFNICYLTKQYRQKANKLTQILEEIRKDEVSDDSIRLLKETLTNTFEDSIEPTQLYTHNVDVDAINDKKLAALNGKRKKITAKTGGDKKILPTLIKSVLSPEYMILKTGAKVMFVKNNTEKGYINGTLGEVIDFSVKGFPIVRTLNNKTIIATSEEWSVDDESGRPLATFRQVPLRLAWAITVHKSQGMTLDAAELDLRKTFEKGQGYVALSRLRDIEHLRLIGFNKTSLQVDSLALKADKRFQELSVILNENSIDDILKAKAKDFIRACGGRVLKKKINTD